MQVRKKSQNQEKSTAKKFGGKTVIASGALWASKADVRSDKFLVECKTTEKDFYSVSSRVWEKIEREAVRDGIRTPVLQVDIKDSSEYTKERYVVITKLYLESIITEVADIFDDYATMHKSFRVVGIPKDSYSIYYSIMKIVPTARTKYTTGLFHNLALLRLDDFLEMIKED
jgi:hypothetical protein